MIMTNNTAKNIKIAYIGGGSRGWAWTFMSDLAKEKALSGEVWLYDIDAEAVERNERIGNNIRSSYPESAEWRYKRAATLEAALKKADFVIISILPGTFAEMDYDLNLPARYGILQPVGDSTGLGGIVRALRTIPMFREIALSIKEFCPDAYVINYTNPMTVCVKTLYEVFPGIRAIGCCHEVFGTQKLLAKAYKRYTGIAVDYREIETEVAGVNHFTWITKAFYKNIDLMPYYRKLSAEYAEHGYEDGKDDNWMNSVFDCANRVKFKLFNEFGAIAAAGDRHLAEFCPRAWFLFDDAQIRNWKFSLTPIEWRKKDLQERLKKSDRLWRNEIPFVIQETGEVGVRMIKSLCGIDAFRTNVNIVNTGQLSCVKEGAVVETNAYFSGIGVEPIVCVTRLPAAVEAMVRRIVDIQEMVVTAGLREDRQLAFQAFCLDPMNTLTLEQSAELFDQMLEKTKKYLPEKLWIRD